MAAYGPDGHQHLGAVGTGSRQPKQQISAGTTCFNTLPPRFISKWDQRAFNDH